MRVLIVHGSKRGGTAGLAAMVGKALEDAGVTADVAPARTVRSLDGYDAVVVGGALYATRWHHDARRFVRRHAAALAARPVWLFSSGPLDDSAANAEIQPVTQVRKAMQLSQARGHATFGGRLAPDAQGFPASSMAKKMSGDWRDPAHVARWASEIAVQLGVMSGAGQAD
jgi:menaquinone-dependent protoporphyrinogen oxidase